MDKQHETSRRTVKPDYYSSSTYVIQKKLVVWCLLQKHVTVPRDYFQLLQTQLAEKTVIQVPISFIFFMDRGRKEEILPYIKTSFFFFCLTSSTLTFSVISFIW